MKKNVGWSYIFSHLQFFLSNLKKAICVEMLSTWLLELHPRFWDGMAEQTQIYCSQRGKGNHLLLRKSSFLALQEKGTWPLDFNTP